MKYIKLFDDGNPGNTLYLASMEPSKELIQKLGLEKSESNHRWYTKIDMLPNDIEIVFVTPYEHEPMGARTRIKNIYICEFSDLDSYLE